MARFLLDTDAVIDQLKGFADTVALLRTLHEAGEDLCVCAEVRGHGAAPRFPAACSSGHGLAAVSLVRTTSI
jgi:hypothetical protein